MTDLRDIKKLFTEKAPDEIVIQGTHITLDTFIEYIKENRSYSSVFLGRFFDCLEDGTIPEYLRDTIRTQKTGTIQGLVNAVYSNEGAFTKFKTLVADDALLQMSMDNFLRHPAYQPASLLSTRRGVLRCAVGGMVTGIGTGATFGGDNSTTREKGVPVLLAGAGIGLSGLFSHGEAVYMHDFTNRLDGYLRASITIHGNGAYISR